MKRGYQRKREHTSELDNVLSATSACWGPDKGMESLEP